MYSIINDEYKKVVSKSNIFSAIFIQKPSKLMIKYKDYPNNSLYIIQKVHFRVNLIYKNVIFQIPAL